MNLYDKYGRKHNYLRISLTDKCNFNCIYCNPNNSSGLNKDNLLTYEEILRVIKLFTEELNFTKIRFTGGEPLVRKGVFDFLSQVKKMKDKNSFTIGITTNGYLLSGNASKLRQLGLDALNISLDSLNPSLFAKITKSDRLENVIRAIDESINVGFDPVKINMVVIKGINDHEVIEFINYFKNKNVNLRFIEFMPFGSNSWERAGFISYKELIEQINLHYSLIPLAKDKNAVAKEYQLSGFKATVGFITSMSEHFCDTCNRLRINSKGDLRVCLFSKGKEDVNFKELFKENCSDNEILTMIQNALNYKWEQHPEAEELVELSSNNMMEIGG